MNYMRDIEHVVRGDWVPGYGGGVKRHYKMNCRAYESTIEPGLWLVQASEDKGHGFFQERCGRVQVIARIRPNKIDIPPELIARTLARALREL